MSIERSRTFLSQEQIDALGFITIIGCGSLGSRTALALGGMGFKYFRLIDNGEVEEVNVGPQAFPKRLIGFPKTTALKRLLKEFSPHDPDELDVVCIQNPIEHSEAYEEMGEIVIFALDSIESRAFAASKLPDDFKLVIDLRMGLQELWLEVILPGGVDRYLKNLPDPASIPDGPCTERAIAYTTYLAAAWAGRTLAAFARGDEFPEELHPDMKVFSQYAIWKKGESL